MKEVSCRFFDVLLRDLRERGVDPHQLVEGTDYSPEHIADKNERVEWTALIRMMENAGRLWTPDELRRLGERSTEGPLVKFIGVVARIRFSVAGFFSWVTAPDGVASQMVTSITIQTRSDGPGRLTVEGKMRPGYAPCREFFLITEGTYAAMPRMLGARRAHVESYEQPDGVRFEIRYTEPTGVIASARRIALAPFTMREAAKELADAHASLQKRYDDLDTARDQIERQRDLLDVAYQLGQQIATERDLHAIGRTVLQTLAERPTVTGARLVLRAHETLSLDQGERSGAATVQHASGEVPGVSVELWTSGPAGDARRLLELLLPTVQLALGNASAYHELAQYQAGLERLVDERTAELRQARDELATLVTQLRDATEARERFFANVSHEIRTPLSLILLAVADIEVRLQALEDTRSHESLSVIGDSARKLLRLVDELLLLAAGQADKLVLAREPTSVSALLDQLAITWRLAAESAGHELRARVQPGIQASVDPVALERIASNLLSNAIKYTPQGGIIEVELELADQIRLSILDTGPGIAADLRARLFGRFERGSGDERRASGTGIGLALVKQLVEAHGGSVEVLPRASGGTEFRVLLPRDSVTEQPRLHEAPRLPTRASVPSTAMTPIESGTVLQPPGLSAGTILVAEDEPRLAHAIAALLADRYKVVVALDGAAALALVAQHEPQLLITDVDMPGMTGIELAREFRQVTGDRLAPIVILSAVIDLRTRVAGLEAGAVDYVSKPFDPDELRARVDAQFRMRDLAVRLHRAEQLTTLAILTSGLAHELRNPANGVVNALGPLIELLPPEIVDPETDTGQLLEAMRLSAEQIAVLVRQLLGFRSNTELELRPCDLAAIIDRARTLASKALTDVSVRVDIPDGLQVRCAGPLLAQALTNLLENAGHAVGPGGWIAVTVSVAGGTTYIEVSDSGPGVPIALRSRIFEPFYTTKPAGQGTGLGLSVSQTIIARHGGTLELREREGRTLFVIALPA